jgi:uncharacterized protein with beta-barrel porin domain
VNISPKSLTDALTPEERSELSVVSSNPAVINAQNYVTQLFNDYALWRGGGNPPGYAPVYDRQGRVIDYGLIFEQGGPGGFPTVAAAVRLRAEIALLAVEAALHPERVKQDPNWRNDRYQQLLSRAYDASTMPQRGADATDPINTIAGRAYAGSPGASALGFSNEPTRDLPEDVALAYAAMITKAPPPAQLSPFAARWTAWASGSGIYNQTSGAIANGSAITARGFLAAAGIEYHFSPRTTIGFALAGGGSNWGQGSGGGRSDTFQASLYGVTAWGPVYVSALTSGGNSRIDSNRFAGADTIRASYDSQNYGARVETGYRYGVQPGTEVMPYAAAAIQYVHTPGYSETDLTGGGQGITYNTLNTTFTTSEIGARLGAFQVVNGVPVLLHARAAWVHEWNDGSSVNGVFQALPGIAFTLAGATPPRDSALTTLEATLRLAPRWTATARFDGSLASTAQTYAGTGELRYRW